MIKLRRNPFSSGETSYPFIEDETLDKCFSRVLLEIGFTTESHVIDLFQIVLNGELVDKELYSVIVIKQDDEILICPRIGRGAGGQLFKTAALVAVAISAVYFNPFAAGTFAAAAFAVGATVAGTLALNALIPPPPLDLPGIGGASSSALASQMYTIASQSNQAKRFGNVPKVYGEHRMFPNIAAAPYTQVEADPSNGTLQQFLYAIYDFGLGPLQVSNIMIGDTPIGVYSDINYRLVDLNRPSVSEGPWDDALNDSFKIYKGDVESEQLSITLDKNEINLPPLDDYQAIRNASTNVNGSEQEIIVDFICPNGLIAYGTDGSTENRTIYMAIEFSRANENVWRSFDDINYVNDYEARGGLATSTYIVNPTVRPLVPANWNLISTSVEAVPKGKIQGSGSYDAHLLYYRNYGIPKGANFVELVSGLADVGMNLSTPSSYLGKVSSVQVLGGGFSRYFFVSPVPSSVVVFTWLQTNIVVPYIPFPEGRLFYPPNPKTTPPNVAPNIRGPLESRTNKIYGKYAQSVSVISAKSSAPVYASFRFKPRGIGEYKVRVTRLQSVSTRNFQIQDRLVWTMITTRFDRFPILTNKRHVFLEIKIRASNQLNGTIDNLSAVCSSVLDVWNGSAWVKQVTNNPAWVVADLITGNYNPRPLEKIRIHTTSFLEWANFCSQIPTPPPTFSFPESRFYCNFVLDFDSTLQSIIAQVCGAAQASLNIIDGKYGILVDKLRTIPVQIFTPRNSWDFSSSRIYNNIPDAIKVRFIDPATNWSIKEAIVYNDGFDETTADKIEEMSSFACTNYNQAWRFGRFMLAQAKLRQETITINVDFENLVCTRGDYVVITQDVMKVGGRPGRVKAISGTIVTLDDAIDTGVGSYGYTFRNPSTGIYTSTCTVISATEFDLDGTLPAIGDLIVIGLVGSITFDCLVKAISPLSDLAATITLVEKANAVYDAESTTSLPDYDPAIVQELLGIPGPVESLEVTANTWRVMGSAYQYYIDIDWDPPTGSAYESFEVYVDSGQGYNLQVVTRETFYEYLVNEDDLGIEHSFKVLAVSPTGLKLTLIEVNSVEATPVRKETPPSDVLALYIDITNQVIAFNWPAISDPDLREYFIRYSPNTVSATWETSIPLLRVDKNTITASYQGRVGTYFIKAVDLNFNESANAALAITSIPSLFDLNVIDETNDFPGLNGVLDTVETDAEGLVLKRLSMSGPTANEFYPVGYYYYENFLDLGEIYTIRLQSYIEAEGYTVGDLMINWITLDQVLALSLAGTSEWDVETQYRATNDYNVMSEWASLDVIDPISEGIQENFTEWKKFTVGDFTGRIFQFRLKLVSNVPNVTPRVFDGIIKADMPDRVENYNNITSSISGTTINYSPAFAGPSPSPNIQITIDNAQSGDYWEFTSKTLTSFTIIFYDSTDTAVVRQFDASVAGYGRKALAVI